MICHLEPVSLLESGELAWTPKPHLQKEMARSNPADPSPHISGSIVCVRAVEGMSG